MNYVAATLYLWGGLRVEPGHFVGLARAVSRARTFTCAGRKYSPDILSERAPSRARTRHEILTAGLGGKLARMRQLAGGTDRLRHSWL
jgi:hypothetical protein